MQGYCSWKNLVFYFFMAPFRLNFAFAVVFFLEKNSFRVSFNIISNLYSISFFWAISERNFCFQVNKFLLAFVLHSHFECSTLIYPAWCKSIKNILISKDCEGNRLSLLSFFRLFFSWLWQIFSFVIVVLGFTMTKVNSHGSIATNLVNFIYIWPFYSWHLVAYSWHIAHSIHSSILFCSLSFVCKTTYHWIIDPVYNDYDDEPKMRTWMDGWKWQWFHVT